jgi:predicted ATPase
MLTRFYVDNFRCFVNFEYHPGRKQLILGGNGSGKSSLVDALLRVKLFLLLGDKADDVFLSFDRTRWLDQPRQTFEIEAELNAGRYLYRLVIEPWGDPSRPRVVEETVTFDGKSIFDFNAGEVHLFNDRFEQKVSYPFDWHRSALATINPRKENQTLIRFKEWCGRIFAFRLNPFSMTARAEQEDLYPSVDLSNFAAWYRHLIQAYPKENAAFLDSLRSVLDGFSHLDLQFFGENLRLLLCEFAQPNGSELKFGFHQLSDGQRCLICLYAVLHFIAAKGGVVILDEPDNFVSLREIQPWLMKMSDSVGQIIIVSHHPELINQWAPSGGVQLVRDGTAPVRVEEFRSNQESNLTPAELIARGWERE